MKKNTSLGASYCGESESENCPDVQASHYSWGTPLVDRIDRTECGCSRRFDPISRIEMAHNSCHPSTLLNLCRNVVLKTIGLVRINMMSKKELKIPSLIAKNILNLKLNDFVINLFKVQTSDIKEGVYRAKTAFSGKDVLLQIIPNMVSQEHLKYQPECLANFEDQDVSCLVWEPTLTLGEMIKTHIRIGQPLGLNFVWKVTQDVSAQIAAYSSTPIWTLNSSKVKISQCDGAVYVDKRPNSELQMSDCSIHAQPEPPETRSLMHKLNQEKVYIWSLGCLLLNMVTITPVQNLNQNRRKMNFRNTHPKSQEEKLKILKSLPESAIKNIIQRSLNSDPCKRPSAKEILRTAAEQLLQHSKGECRFSQGLIKR